MNEDKNNKPEESKKPSENTEHPVFHYTVDDEELTTREHTLTPRQILELAGLNPSTYYLEQIIGHDKKSYKGHPDETIHMHEHMKFISVFIGDTPVSELS